MTDLGRGSFHYEQRTAGLPPGALPPALDISVGGWRLSGANGTDRLRATMDGYVIDLVVTPLKPPVLQNGDGIISLGQMGDSYYYSRTRLAVEGTLVDHGLPIAVTGQAWMDHQWGDFPAVGGAGRDWFSAQLDDGTEFTASVVRDVTGALARRLQNVGTRRRHVRGPGRAGCRH